MKKWIKHLSNGAYPDAIAELSRIFQRDKTDDFQIGAAYDLGIVMLLAGRIEDAHSHFIRLQSKALASVSLHHIGIGLTYWARSDWKMAVQAWRDGLKCEYKGYQGLDVPFMLYFASLHQPKIFPKNKAINLLQEWLPRVNSEAFQYAVVKYLLDEMSEDMLLVACDNYEGKYAAKLSEIDRSNASFYISLRFLAIGDMEGYRRSLQCCKVSSYSDGLHFEFAVSQIEIQLRSMDIGRG